MKKQLVFALIAILFLTGSALAAGGKITGIILDAETGDPVPFATVAIDGTSLAPLLRGEMRERPTPIPYRFLDRAGRTHRIGVADVYASRADGELHIATPVIPPQQQGELIAEMLRSRATAPLAPPRERWIAVRVTP
jgi:hypothetical protein